MSTHIPNSAWITMSMLAPLTLAVGVAQASVVVDGTRVVYISGKREVSVSLRNVGDVPSLVQIWIDAGDARARPDEASVPFVLTPPLFRLDPAKGQTLRLIYTQQRLPNDRETIFWLNVLDIPPRGPAADEALNRLEMAFRHRLKLFFRPANLRGDAGDAPAAVIWTIARQDNKAVLEARNPTPYYISLADVEVCADGVTVAAQTDMLAPFASKQFPLAKPDRPLMGQITIRYGFVNDFGAIIRGQAAVSVMR